MQIGDKVRFLNEVGGGVISGFEGSDIILVTDEFGFEIPTLRSDVVVIETDSNNFVRRKTPGLRSLKEQTPPQPTAATAPTKPQERVGEEQPTAGEDNDDEDDYEPEPIQPVKEEKVLFPADTLVKVDLHIDALLDDTEGMSPSVLLNTQMTEFRVFMERYLHKKGTRLVFLHGKSQHELRESIMRELERHYAFCQHYWAGLKDYGFSGTIVVIK